MPSQPGNDEIHVFGGAGKVVVCTIWGLEAGSDGVGTGDVGAGAGSVAATVTGLARWEYRSRLNLESIGGPLHDPACPKDRVGLAVV